MCTSSFKVRDFLKVTFYNHKISGWRRSLRGHIEQLPVHFLKPLPQYSCQVMLAQRGGTHHLMRKLFPYSDSSNCSTIFSAVEIKLSPGESHLLVLILVSGAPIVR